MSDDENLFSDFSYASWAPEELQQLYPTLESAIVQLESTPNLEAAFVLFWKLRESSNPEGEFMPPESLEKILRENTDADELPQLIARYTERVNIQVNEREERLANLVERLEPLFEPDEPIRAKDAYIYAHVACAFALVLERTDLARTERHREVCEKALAVLLKPLSDRHEVDEAETLELITSNELVKTMLWAQRFHEQIDIRSYESALEALYHACDACLESDAVLYDLPGGVTVEDWIAMGEGRLVTMGDGGDSIGRGPGILARGSGQHWMAYLIPAQEAANAFEHLVNTSPNQTDWQKVALWCLYAQSAWDEPAPPMNVRTALSKIEEPARDFWIVARGIALLKMSPDTLVKFLEQQEKTASETRLRRYFFGELWDYMPTAAQQALIAADRAYSTTEGRRDDVFENLRIAVESVLEATLVVPFKRWLNEQSIEFVSAPNELFLPLSRTIAELWRENEKRFDEYTDSHHPNLGRDFWDWICSSVTMLRDVRGRAVHPEGGGPPKRQAIAISYDLFVGINQPGVINSLLKLRQDTQPALLDSDLL